MNDLKVNFIDFRTSSNELINTKMTYATLVQTSTKKTTLASMTNHLFKAANEIYLATLKVYEDSLEDGNILTLEDIRAELKKVCINFQTVLTIDSEITNLKKHLNEAQSGDGIDSSNEQSIDNDIQVAQQQLKIDQENLSKLQKSVDERISDLKKDEQEYSTKSSQFDIRYEELNAREGDVHLKIEEYNIKKQEVDDLKAKVNQEYQETKRNNDELTKEVAAAAENSAKILKLLQAAIRREETANQREQLIKQKEKEFNEKYTKEQNKNKKAASKQTSDDDESDDHDKHDDEEEDSDSSSNESTNKKTTKSKKTSTGGYKLDKKALAIFAGKKEENVEDWLLITKSTLEMAGIPDENRLHYILPVLRDAALQYTIAFINKHKNNIKKWLLFQEGFKLAFVPIDLQDTLRREIKYIKCTGTIDDHNRAFMILRV